MTEQLRTKWLRIKKRNVILNTTERGLAYENAYTWSVEKIFGFNGEYCAKSVR